MSEEKKKKGRTRAELKKLERELIDKLSTLITTAFGLVAALAWNVAI